MASLAPAGFAGRASLLALGLCLLTWTLTNVDQALFGYALPGILQEFSLPLTGAGVILTISFASAAILAPLAGMAADRLGRGTMLALLLACSALFVGLQGLATGVFALTLFRSIAFGLSAGLSPITTAVVAECSPPRYRGIAMGVLQCGYPLGWLLASLASVPLLEHYGWRAACLFGFAVVPLAIFMWPLLKRVLPEPPPRAEVGTPVGVRTLFLPENRRNSLVCALIFFMFGGAYAGSAFFFPTYFAQARGYSEAEAASLVGLSNGLAVFGYLAAAVVGEFLITRRNTFIFWCLGGGAAFAGMLWLSTSRLTDLAWFTASAAMFYGAMAVLPVVAAEIFPARIRASALGLCASAPLSLGFTVFPVIVPMAVEKSGWASGMSMVIIPLLAIAALAGLALPNPRSGTALSTG